MSTLSWQAGNAADCYITGRLVQGLISVNNPDYEPQRWQGTLLIFVMVLLLLVVNIWGHDFWPKVQNPIMIIHALAFCGVVIVLWVLAPKQDPKVVFTKFHNGGGWNTQGLSLMVGQISAIYALLGTFIPHSPLIEDKHVKVTMFLTMNGRI
jgi:amino acid transporter